MTLRDYWKEWLKSDEGKRCLSRGSKEFHLDLAFRAGASAQQMLELKPLNVIRESTEEAARDPRIALPEPEEES